MDISSPWNVLVWLLGQGLNLKTTILLAVESLGNVKASMVCDIAQ